MLDHSGWSLTANKIDFVIKDKSGQILMCEFSRHFTEWRQLSKDQYSLYESLVLAGRGSILAVLCKHSVSPHLQIDTANHVESFQIMQWTQWGVRTYGVSDGKDFKTFVQLWASL